MTSHSTASERHKVELSPRAEKDLKRLRPGTVRAARAILQLEDDPYRAHALAGSVGGTRSLEFSVKGSGARAVYVVIDPERTCLVHIIGPHENISAKAERRARTFG